MPIERTKINLSIPVERLSQLDRLAEENGLTRSGMLAKLIADAVEEKERESTK